MKQKFDFYSYAKFTFILLVLIASFVVLDHGRCNSYDALTQGTYLRYAVIRTLNVGDYRLSVKVTATDDYLVMNCFDNTILIQQHLWGVIGWPEESVDKRIYYLNETGVAYIRSSDGFSFASLLLFENGILKGITDDGVYDVVFQANTSGICWKFPLNTPSYPMFKTLLFLTSIPYEGENLILCWNFTITSIKILPEYNSRKVITAIGNETKHINGSVWRRNLEAFWDYETGLLLKFSYISFCYDINAKEVLLWELKETNLFELKLKVDEPRRLILNTTYQIYPKLLKVYVSENISIKDIINIESIAFKINQIYNPSNFSAYDLENDFTLKIENEYRAGYIIVRIFFPRVILAGESYSFRFTYWLNGLIVKLGEWYQVTNNYVVYGMPTYYSFTLKVPSGYIIDLQQSFIRKEFGDVLLQPLTHESDNMTTISFATSYMSGNDEFNIVLNFREIVYSVDIVSVQIPSEIYKGTNQTLKVIIENKGDDCFVLIKADSVGGLWISEPQKTYLEQGTRKVVTFGFTPIESGETLLVVSVYKDSTKLDSEYIKFVVNFLSGRIEKVNTPRMTVDLEDWFNITVLIRNNGTVGSVFSVRLSSFDGSIYVLNNNQTVYLNGGSSKKLSFSVKGLKKGNSSLLILLECAGRIIDTKSVTISISSLSRYQREVNWFVLTSLGIIVGLLYPLLMRRCKRFRNFIDQIFSGHEFWKKCMWVAPTVYIIVICQYFALQWYKPSYFMFIKTNFGSLIGLCTAVGWMLLGIIAIFEYFVKKKK